MHWERIKVNLLGDVGFKEGDIKNESQVSNVSN